MPTVVPAPAVRGAWPENVRITAERTTAFIHPTTLCLPRERKIYVFGGRQLTTGKPIDLNDVAIHYRVPNFLRATSVEAVETVSQPITSNASLRILNPGWAATFVPLDPTSSLSSDPAVYVFGNWTSVTSTLWRFDKSGLTEIEPSSGDRPPPRAWASLTRFDANRLVLVGGNNGTNNRLADIWVFSFLPRTWARYLHTLSFKRDDFQSAVYSAPGSVRYLIVFGYAQPLLKHVAIDKGTPPVTATIDKSLAAGLDQMATNSLVIHDSHMFVLGGSPMHYMSEVSL
ncbi:hypothetical protein H9P43_002718 [Blastocladiella emersonii ATCC 22665]|nr:hypothetical protein H9P43_002718 [Blastocladiella emersonii ATCC 22665]